MVIDDYNLFDEDYAEFVKRGRIAFGLEDEHVSNTRTDHEPDPARQPLHAERSTGES